MGGREGEGEGEGGLLFMRETARRFRVAFQYKSGWLYRVIPTIKRDVQLQGTLFFITGCTLPTYVVMLTFQINVCRRIEPLKPCKKKNIRRHQNKQKKHPRKGEFITVLAAVLLGIPCCSSLARISGLHTASR